MYIYLGPRETINNDYNAEVALNPKKLTDSSEYKNSLYGRNISEALLKKLNGGLFQIYFIIFFFISFSFFILINLKKKLICSSVMVSNSEIGTSCDKFK